MEIQKKASSSLSDSTKTPITWLFAACAVVVTLAVAFASEKVATVTESIVEIKGDIKQMGDSVSALNSNVTVLLNERDNTKKDIARHDLELIELRRQLSKVDRR